MHNGVEEGSEAQDVLTRGDAAVRGRVEDGARQTASRATDGPSRARPPSRATEGSSMTVLILLGLTLVDLVDIFWWLWR